MSCWVCMLWCFFVNTAVLLKACQITTLTKTPWCEQVWTSSCVLLWLMYWITVDPHLMCVRCWVLYITRDCVDPYLCVCMCEWTSKFIKAKFCNDNILVIFSYNNFINATSDPKSWTQTRAPARRQRSGNTSFVRSRILSPSYLLRGWTSSRS